MAFEFDAPHWTRDWGVVEKCPYCSAINIRRKNKQQKTCGAEACRLQLGFEAKQRRARAKKIVRLG